MDAYFGNENSRKEEPGAPDLKMSDNLKMEQNSDKIGWKRNILWRGVNFLMAFFFALAAYVQLNDPDPVLWMFVYAVPGTLCLSVAISLTVQDHHIWQALATADFCGNLAGAIYLATLIKPHMERDSITNPLVLEEGREMSGLMVAMLWIGISKIVSWYNQRQGKLSLGCWIFIVIICLIPFALWAYCYRTLDKKALPGHCQDML